MEGTPDASPSPTPIGLPAALRRRPFLWACGFTLLVFGLNFLSGRRAPCRDIDETGWIHSGHFLHSPPGRGGRLPEGFGMDGLDHPVLAKYAFGLVLSLSGIAIDRDAIDQSWNIQALDPRRYDALLRRNLSALPAGALPAGRLLGALCMAGAALLLFLLLEECFCADVALLGTAFFVLSRLVLYLSGLAIADPLLLLILLTPPWLHLRGLRRERSAAARAICALLIGAACGLCFLTKLNGLVSLLAALAALLIPLRPPEEGAPWSWRRRAGLALLCCGAFALTVLVLDPSLRDAPVSFVTAMFEHRMRALRLQLALCAVNVLPSPAASLSYLLGTLLLSSDWLFVLLRVPVLLFLFCLGLLILPSRSARAPWSSAVLGIHAALWTLATLWTLRLNWTRYLLPAAPFVYGIAALGAEGLWKGLRAAASPRWGRARTLALAGILCLAAAGWSSYFSLSSIRRRDPDAAQRAQEKSRALLEKVFDDRPRTEPLGWEETLRLLDEAESSPPPLNGRAAAP